MLSEDAFALVFGQSLAKLLWIVLNVVRQRDLLKADLTRVYFIAKIAIGLIHFLKC